MLLRKLILVGWSVAAGCVGAGCVGDGEINPAVSGQIVGADERPLGPGLTIFERGPVHEGQYETGSVIGEDGKFVVDLPVGGKWGIHIFHDDYFYMPAEVTLEENEQVILTSVFVLWGYWMEVTGQPSWPDQPTDATKIALLIDDDPSDNPVISDIQFTYTGTELSPGQEVMDISMNVFDPDEDMSRMALVFDPSTGGGFAMNPPSPPDANGNYPNGVYTLSVIINENHVPGESEWKFVASDNVCNNSPILTLTMPPR